MRILGHYNCTKTMRIKFRLWHLFLLIAVVALGLWAWSLARFGGVSLVAAWACGAASEISRHEQQVSDSATNKPKIPKTLNVLDAGLIVLLLYWLCFHFSTDAAWRAVR